MADKVVRFVPGQFIDPIHDVDRINPIIDSNTSNILANDGVIQSFLISQAKGAVGTVVSRVGKLTGNESLARELEAITGIVGDIATVSTGFAAGGPLGAIVAGLGVAIKNGIEIFDGTTEQRINDLSSAELARRSGISVVSKRGAYR